MAAPALPMRSKLLPIVAGLVSVLLLAAGALYVYDATRSDLIAEGVTVNGVSVGGLKANEARVVLRRALADPLQRPVVVRHGDRRFKLTARRARVEVDVDASVDRALDVSHTGNLVSRAWRSATGGRVEQDIPVDVAYSKKAVRRLVSRVSDALARKPVDADVEISGAGVSRVPARKGRRVRADRLRRQVTRTLLATEGTRRLRAPTAPVKPDVTDKELVERYPAILVVNRGAFTLTLY
jgi:vancomycin resistance protein YoaR